MASDTKGGAEMSVREQVYVVEIVRRVRTEPVAVHLYRNSAAIEMREWQSANPDDHFRISTYVPLYVTPKVRK